MALVRDVRTIRARSTICLLLISAACSSTTSTLNARGTAAASIADLWWLMTALAALVFIAVVSVLLMTLRQRAERESNRQRAHATLLGALGTSALILTIVFIASERTMAVVHNAVREDDLLVRVKAWQWWWEVTYDSPGTADTLVTANEIHIPIGRRVRLELTTGDVIHSLWVPNLQGKVDLVPGRTHTLWLQADRPGISHAPCAEYCGIQHAHMTLLVVAHAQAEFDAWQARERLPAATAMDSLRVAGAAVFGRACAYCHMVRGTPSLGKLGPDLTHFGSRRTLASATLENSPQHLAAWLADPQRVKPGSRMPTVPLSAPELAAVVAYVAGLR